jgi:hypothetical protein
MHGVTPPHPLHVVIIWCLVKHRDSFIFKLVTRDIRIRIFSLSNLQLSSLEIFESTVVKIVNLVMSGSFILINIINIVRIYVQMIFRLANIPDMYCHPLYLTTSYALE